MEAPTGQCTIAAGELPACSDGKFCSASPGHPNPTLLQEHTRAANLPRGGDVSAPQLIFAPNPEFSEEAKREKYQGVCVISTIVDAEGNPQRVQVVQQLGKGLDQKAVEAVQQYKFEPAMRNGEPVAVEVNIEVNFWLY